MSDAERYIRCAEHGEREAAFVCRHLPEGQGLGFHQGFGPDEPDAAFPDAWCDACDAVRRAEGAWNPRSESVARIQLICSACYLRSRLLNWPRHTLARQAELIRRSVQYLQMRQNELARDYRLNDHARYDWNQETGKLLFSTHGLPAVVADFQFVGSVSARTGTWLWSWANKSDLEPVRSQVRRVRAHGDQHQLMKLACAYWDAEEEDGWEMAAVAAYLLKAKGAYRSPDAHRFTFLIMTDVNWVQ